MNPPIPITQPIQQPATALSGMISAAQKQVGTTQPNPSTTGASNSTPSPLQLPSTLNTKDVMTYGAMIADGTFPKEMTIGDMAKMAPLLQSHAHDGYSGNIATAVHTGSQGQATTGSLPTGYDPKANYNGFLASQCTSYASWYWTNVLGKKFVDEGGNGNAKNWPDLAKEQGYTTSSTPQAGDIVSWPNMGQYGHVAIVQGVNPDGTINVSEMNYVPDKYTVRNSVSAKGGVFIH